MGWLLGWLRVLALRRLRKLTLGWVLLAWLAGAVRRSRSAAADVPLSPVRAGRFVGADFLERTGLVDRDAPAPTGELDALAEFAAGSFDPDRVPGSVRRFYERTADYEMDYRVTWSLGFRAGAALAGRLTSRIEQLNLPNRRSGWRPLESRFVAVDVPADPRAEVRGWVRTTSERGEDNREAVFVALYGAHEAAGDRFVNIAVPLPGGNLSTVLRPRDASRGIEWTTEGGGDPGLYLVTPLGAFRLPMSQRFVVWDESEASRAVDGDEVDMPAGSNDVAGDGEGSTPDAGTDLRARHEMEVFGLQFLTVEYRLARAGSE